MAIGFAWQGAGSAVHCPFALNKQGLSISDQDRFDGLTATNVQSFGADPGLSLTTQDCVLFLRDNDEGWQV
jgi:hypothetical protein